MQCLPTWPSVVDTLRCTKATALDMAKPLTSKQCKGLGMYRDFDIDVLRDFGIDVTYLNYCRGFRQAELGNVRFSYLFSGKYALHETH